MPLGPVDHMGRSNLCTALKAETTMKINYNFGKIDNVVEMKQIAKL